MRKRLLVLLAFAICLTLFAGSKAQRGEPDQEFILCQEWREVRQGTPLIFWEDGTFLLEDHTFRYEYDSNRKCVLFSIVTEINIDVFFEDDTYKLRLGGAEFVPAPLYEAFHAKYVAGRVASLTDARTELTVGNTYTTADGLTFSFDGAEIEEWNGSDGAYGVFCFCITPGSDAAICFDGVSYESPRTRISFSLWEKEGEGQSRLICGLSGDGTGELEADCEEFGILSFRLGGTDYYISIGTFFV